MSLEKDERNEGRRKHSREITIGGEKVGFAGKNDQKRMGRKEQGEDRDRGKGERRFSLSWRTKDGPIMETPFHKLAGRFIFSPLSMKLGEGGLGGRSVFKKGREERRDEC